MQKKSASGVFDFPFRVSYRQRKAKSLLRKLMIYDKTTFEHLYKSNYRQMYRFAFSLLEEAEDARDAVSHVFTQMWHTQPQLQEGCITGFNAGDIPMTDGFGTGRYMMLLEGPWKTAEMNGAYPDFKYGTSNMPAGSGGSHSVLGGEDIAMFKGGNSEGAWLFMKFMTSEFAQEEMAKCGQIPVNKTALESDTVKNAAFAPFLEAITTAVARPPVASWSEIDNLLSVAVTDIIVNGADAQTKLDALAAQVDALLVG